MGASRLPMRQLHEILRLKHEGLPHRAIARACGVGVGTVSAYVRRAERAGVGWPLPADIDETTLEARLFPRAEPVRERQAPDLPWIHQELRKAGVTLQLLWEEYRSGHPEGYGYSQFCEIYRRWARRLRPSMRQVHRAGEKTFIDFSGQRLHLVDRRTGEEIPVELFVAVPGASDYTYEEATPSQRLRGWVGVHTRMAEYFGGSTKLCVPDQLKSPVTTPCRYEPDVNRTYQELAGRYGAVVMPARPGKVKDMAKVEGAVLLAQRWILARLRNRTFFELGELNEAVVELLEDLNGRPMQKLRVTRRELWERLDRLALLPPPSSRYEQAQWKTCRVNIDYHVEIARHFYSVPYQLIHETIEARHTASIVEVYYKGRRVTSHPRRYDHKPATLAEHMPSSHRAHAEWTPSRLIGWAEKAGAATGRVVAEILRSRPHREQGYRACLGLIRLGRRYGDDRLDAACARAERLRSYSYRTVKNILASAQDRLPLEDEPSAPAPGPCHANIRLGEYYAAQEEPKC